MNESQRDAEAVIFDLRKRVALYLQAGNTDEVNRIQQTIAHLQEVYGAITGAGRKRDNDPTA